MRTATPWKYEPGSKTIRSVKENYWLATMDSWDGAVDNEANAEFIVKAVNAHDALVEALTLALPYVESALEDKGYKPGVVDRMTKTIRDALALAEGKEAAQAAPSVHIKLRPKGKKRFEFLSGNGGLNHLRIHAAMFTPERAAQVISEIKAEHGDKYETKVEAF